MSALFAQQQALLQQQLQVLARIESGLRYSLERLPEPLAPGDLGKAEVLERLASINDRYTKLQDQLSTALRHAHAMIGERYRGFADVIDWAVRQDLIAQAEVWMELRACAIASRMITTWKPRRPSRSSRPCATAWRTWPGSFAGSRPCACNAA